MANGQEHRSLEVQSMASGNSSAIGIPLTLTNFARLKIQLK